MYIWVDAGAVGIDVGVVAVDTEAVEIDTGAIEIGDRAGPSSGLSCRGYISCLL